MFGERVVECIGVDGVGEGIGEVVGCMSCQKAYEIPHKFLDFLY